MEYFRLVWVLSFLIFPVFSFAQDPGATGEVLNQIAPTEPSATPKPLNLQERLNNRQTNIQNRIENRQQNIQERLDTRQVNIQEKFAERKNKLQERLETRKANIAERRAKLTENIKARVDNLIGNVFNRLTNATNKLNEVASRIQTRIDSLKENGVDTTSAESLLNEAKSKIDTAIADVNAGKETLTNATKETISKGDIRAIIDEIKASIKSAHDTLRNVMPELKGAGQNSNSN